MAQVMFSDESKFSEDAEDIKGCQASLEERSCLSTPEVGEWILYVGHRCGPSNILHVSSAPSVAS